MDSFLFFRRFVIKSQVAVWLFVYVFMNIWCTLLKKSIQSCKNFCRFKVRSCYTYIFSFMFLLLCIQDLDDFSWFKTFPDKMVSVQLAAILLIWFGYAPSHAVITRQGMTGDKVEVHCWPRDKTMLKNACVQFGNTLTENFTSLSKRSPLCSL